jgi:hypothetical protein
MLVFVFFSQSPYCVAVLGDLTSQTSIADACGVNPTWNAATDHGLATVDYDPLVAGTTLSIQVWNDHPLANELIGKIEVNISDIATSETLKQRLANKTWYKVDTGGFLQCSIVLASGFATSDFSLEVKELQTIL